MLKCNDEYGGLCGNCSEFILEEHDKRIIADERAKVIDEFVAKCKTIHDGLICNWDKPYGITFDKLEEIAKDLHNDIIENR